MKRKIILTAVAAAAIAVSAQAQSVIQAPAGQAYAIVSNVPASAVNPVTYQWYRNGSPIQGATRESYTVPGSLAYGDNVTFYRMAKAQECAGEAEKPSNSITITFFGYVIPVGCNLVIAGLCWADANVDALQTFAARPDMHTKFYQWNRLTAYSADDPLTPAWNSTADQSEVWTVNPCPNGWRLPSENEYQLLNKFDSKWEDVGMRGNQVAGRFYGYNYATCSLPSNMEGCIFFPASSLRSNDNSDGAFGVSGSGYYWSSTQYNSSSGLQLSFNRTSSFTSYNWKAHALPIRCVR